MSTTNKYQIGKLEVTTPADWFDTTHEIKEHNPPFTLARPDGVGVLQFSAAAFKAGMVPQISSESLHHLLANFAQSRELGRGHDFAFNRKPNLLVAASFDIEERYLRVWYCSDGQSIVLVTYNCQRGQQQIELPDCESIVNSLTFRE